jgi:hypothetical protein
MPHSPYHDVVYPPIHDLEDYRRDLRQLRSGYERSERNEDTEYLLLECGDSLLEHCDFLNTKLEIKVRVYWWINTSASLPENIMQWQAC